MPNIINSFISLAYGVLGFLLEVHGIIF